MDGFTGADTETYVDENVPRPMKRAGDRVFEYSGEFIFDEKVSEEREKEIAAEKSVVRVFRSFGAEATWFEMEDYGSLFILALSDGRFAYIADLNGHPSCGTHEFSCCCSHGHGLETIHDTKELFMDRTDLKKTLAEVKDTFEDFSVN